MSTSPIAPLATPATTVTAVVVSWNTVDLLDECLRSLRKHSGASRLDVVVVDNGSHDGSAELVRRRWPDVQLVANAENRGYQAANNQGVRLATGEHVLLINADAMLMPGCLDRLVARMATDPTAAVVGPRLVYGDGSFQRWTAGRLPSPASAAVSFLGADRLWPHAGIWLGRDVREAFRPAWVSSACMLVRRAALDDTGLMDERFFAYMDDVDLCARAGAAGWSVWYEPAATATHLMGQSTKRVTGRPSPLAVESFLRYVELTRGRRSARSVAAIAMAGFALRAGAHTALGTVRGHHRSAASAHRAQVALAWQLVRARGELA
jgi:hypothetical protein